MAKHSLPTEFEDELKAMLTSDMQSHEDDTEAASARYGGTDPEEGEELEEQEEVLEQEEAAEVAEEPEETQAEFDARSAFETMERKFDTMAGYLANSQQQRAPQQPQYQQPAPQQQEDYVLTAQSFEQSQYAQQMRQIQHVQFQMIAQQEASPARAAADAMRARYPDFDSVIPPQEIQKALQTFSQKGQFGQPWSERFEQAYKVMTYDKVRSRADELAAKREKKRAATTRVAASVPASGAVFQQPAPRKSNKTERGYKSAIDGMFGELKGLM